MLRQQAPPFEVLIADGRSDDGTRQILERFAREYPNVKMLDNAARFTSSGLNLAIAAARAPIIMRMDCHTQYREDYIAECVRVLEETGASNVGGAARTRPAGFRARLFAAAYRHPFSCGGALFHDENYEGPIDTVPYGCWRRELFDQIGMFDEMLVRNQDDEFNLRTLRAGGRIWQSRRIVSWYEPRTSLSALFRQYFQYGYWKVAVIRKHRIPASWRHLVPGAFVAMVLGLPLTVGAAAAIGIAKLAILGAAAWVAVLSVYAVSAASAALLTISQNGPAASVALPVLFAIYHVSYGLGFLSGILAAARNQRAVPARAADITR